MTAARSLAVQSHRDQSDVVLCNLGLFMLLLLTVDGIQNGLIVLCGSVRRASLMANVLQCLQVWLDQKKSTVSDAMTKNAVQTMTSHRFCTNCHH